MNTDESGQSVVVDRSVPLFGARKRARELADEVGELKSQLDRLGGLTVLELESKRDALAVEIASQQEQLASDKAAAEEALAQQAREATESLSADLAEATAEKTTLHQQLSDLRAQVVVTEETALLQEAGVYEYHHPLRTRSNIRML